MVERQWEVEVSSYAMSKSWYSIGNRVNGTVIAL